MHFTLALLVAAVATAAVSPIDEQLVLPPAEPRPAHATFSLRHIFHHGTYRHPTLHRKMGINAVEAKVFLPAEAGFPKEELPPLRVKT